MTITVWTSYTMSCWCTDKEKCKYHIWYACWYQHWVHDERKKIDTKLKKYIMRYDWFDVRWAVFQLFISLLIILWYITYKIINAMC